jgi:hypothetical protein
VGKGRAKNRKAAEIVGPTPEQMGVSNFRLEDVTDKRNGGGTITIGKAYRRRPMIETLYSQGLFSDSQYKALKHYRHHADMTDRSTVRDSLCTTRGGGGDGPSVGLVNAVQVVGACEMAAGSLRDILRAVVVDDLSLSQWAITKAGAIEDCEMKKGQRVCRLKPRQKALAVAKMEIRIAAHRVEAELSA